MLTSKELKKIAGSKLKDAQVLFANKRYDGAFYNAGYSVECSLKAIIAETIGWPENLDEKKLLNELHSHDLEKLLKNSGKLTDVQTNLTTEWYYVNSYWTPDVRYVRVKNKTKTDAKEMIESCERLCHLILQ